MTVRQRNAFSSYAYALMSNYFQFIAPDSAHFRNRYSPVRRGGLIV